MKASSNRSGFTLVELLTVIAIIAILAAIIFPVMGVVRDRARQNHCMTNLKQMAFAVQQFKVDNRKYPATLGPTYNEELHMDQVRNVDCLYPEYTKSSVKIFHCPSSFVVKTKDRAIYLKNPSDGPLGETITVYAYGSYDCYVPRSWSANNPVAYTRYTLQWTPSGHPDAISYLLGNEAPPPDPSLMEDGGSAQTEAVAEEDYARQLKFRNPPGDTVVTWCSVHESNFDGDNPALCKGNALVVFLDGHADIIPAAVVETSKWRTRPKKG